MQHSVVQRSHWESGGATPPMPQKRKKAKKEKKNKAVISAPFNVRYVDMMETPHQLQDQTKFPVEHIATMPMEQQLASLSPSDSLRHVRTTLQNGVSWTKQVLLCITKTALVVKDGVTKEPMLEIPLARINRTQFLDEGEHSCSILMIDAQDELEPSGPHTHFFNCSKTPAQVICKEINQAMMSSSLTEGHDKKQRKDIRGNFNEHTHNWVLQAPANHPPPPSIPAPSLPMPTPPKLPHPTPPDTLPSSLLLAPSQGSQNLDLQHHHDADSGSFSSPVTKDKSSSSKNTSSFTPRSQAEGGQISEMRRRMKAARIQRDVDILNHVIEDLDDFIRMLKNKAAAWNELEKKKKRSKRKKHDAAMDELRLRAEPPSEEEFKEIYSKCKFALNLIAKLGHHLSAPSASELQAGIFSVYISHFVSINKGTQLASAIVSPLLTQHALEMLSKKLPPAETEIWKQLGPNWFLTIDTWPGGALLPPEYEVRFRDGCIPPNLHNASDCPANFPTLDTLPREKRPNYVEYSDAYDMANQPEAESGLLINPAVKAAVESQFAVVASVPHKKGETKITKAVSQQSLISQGSHSSTTAQALFNYKATTRDELSVHKGECIEVLDDSRKWWRVRNQQGETGYVPGNIMEGFSSKKGGESTEMSRGKVPVSPASASPSLAISRRPSVSQTGHIGRKTFQQSPLSPLLELSEAQYSTVLNPHHPPLPPPPSFSPALPHQSRPPVPPAPPTVNNVVGGPPPPPPPPPIVPQRPPLSLNEMLAQHRQKSKQEGKIHKTSMVQKGKDNQFDIAQAMKTRKPLRKTTKANLMVEVGQEDGGKYGPLTKNRPLTDKGTSGKQDEPDMQSCILPWKADTNAIKLWLVQQGFGNCTEKRSVSINEGSQLYSMDKEAMREMFGSSDGVRLYSQLQRDKSQSEREAGVEKETEFQKMMRVRKYTLDNHGSAGVEPTILKFRKPPQVIKERETTLDSTPGHSSRVKTSHRRKATYGTKNGKNRYQEDDSGPYYSDYDLPSPRKGHRLSDNFKDGRQTYRGRQSNPRRRSGVSNSNLEKRRMTGLSRRSSQTSDSLSDSYSYDQRGRGGRKGQPTNIDDFDEEEWDESRSDSFCSETSEQSSRHHQLRSSASASNIPNATWALQGTEIQEGAASEARIKLQQAEIKKMLSQLREMQRRYNVKALPTMQQGILKRDVQNLEVIQRKQKDTPANVKILTQLIGQQMILIDHLKDAIDSITGLPLTPPSTSLPFHYLHQQALAQQQAALVQQPVLAHHHSLAQQQLIEAEKQLLLEHQKQLQLAQLASHPQSLLGMQSQTYGIYGSPYSGMTYF